MRSLFSGQTWNANGIDNIKIEQEAAIGPRSLTWNGREGDDWFTPNVWLDADGHPASWRGRDDTALFPEDAVVNFQGGVDAAAVAVTAGKTLTLRGTAADGSSANVLRVGGDVSGHLVMDSNSNWVQFNAAKIEGDLTLKSGKLVFHVPDTSKLGVLEVQPSGTFYIPPTYDAVALELAGLRGDGVITTRWGPGTEPRVLLIRGEGEYTFTGPVRDTSAEQAYPPLDVRKEGSGTQVISYRRGDTFVGEFTVAEGTLVVDKGARSPRIRVEDGARLVAYSGTVPTSAGDRYGSVEGQIEVEEGGLLTLGESPAELVVDDRLILEGTARFQIGGTARGTEYDSIVTNFYDYFFGAIEVVPYGGYDLSADATYLLVVAPDGLGELGRVSVDGLELVDDGTGLWEAEDEAGIEYSFDEMSGVLTVGNGGDAGGDYLSWLTHYFGDPHADAEADPDGDGLPNLLEYVLGGDPTVAEAGLLPEAMLEGGNIVFRLTRRASAAAEVRQVLEFSRDLQLWDKVEIVASDMITIEMDESGENEVVTITLVPGTLPGGRVFGRLRAELK